MNSMAAVEARIAQIQHRIDQVMRPPVSSGVGWGPGLSGVGAGPAGTAFSSAYHQALNTQSATAPPPAPALQVPAALAVYGNGTVPADALSPIGIGDHRLYGPAATGFQQMTAAAAADGVSIGVTDSYRSYGDQVDLANRKGLYADGGLGAVPGSSPHGWGLALDVDVNDAGQAWLRANGSKYGFYETVPREPWHWEYRGS
jgi:hypothetical protein